MNLLNYFLRLEALLVCGLLFFGAVSVNAEPINKNKLLTAQELLKNIQPQSGKFEQRIIAGGGEQRLSGSYRMDFPQRFRFVLQTKEIITIGGAWISIQQYKGAEANRFPVAATPLALLRKIAEQDFAPTLIAPYIVKLETSSGQSWLTLKDKSGKIGGEISLVFSANKILRGWRAKDAQNNITEVQFYDVVSAPQPRKNFIVEEDE